MNHRNRLNAIVTGLDGFSQAIEISRLTEWVKRVSRRHSQDLLCRGIAKFIELDPLRYGHYEADLGFRHGFAAVRQSTELRDFIDNSIWPNKPVVAAMLELLADRTVLVDTGQRNSQPEFIFYDVVEPLRAVTKCRLRRR